MARPIVIPNVFQNQTGNIPLSQLDTDFSTIATAVNDPASYANYAVDSGAVNAYIITLNPAPSSLASMVGVTITFKPLVTNTGASTINVNGFGPINILNPNGVALIAGEIVAGSMSTIIYDGTQYRLTGGLGAGVFTTVTTPIINSATTLQLATNSGISAVTIDASQSVGIGVIPISGTTNAQLQVYLGIGIVNSNSGINGNIYYASGWKYFGNGTGAEISFNKSSTVALEIDVVSNNVSGSGASATPIPAMTIDPVGTILAVAPAGLGYGTGSGGTVTQATSKSTAVTLNKPTGQITTSNSALAAGTQTNFTFANSLIGASDSIILCMNYSTLYSVRTATISAGNCVIVIKNEYSTSLSEPLIINFAIIKGATA